MGAISGLLRQMIPIPPQDSQPGAPVSNVGPDVFESPASPNPPGVNPDNYYPSGMDVPATGVPLGPPTKTPVKDSLGHHLLSLLNGVGKGAVEVAGNMGILGLEPSRVRKMRDAQMANLQAEATLRQAQANELTNPTMIDTPMGPMPEKLWKVMAPVMLRNQGALDVQGERNKGALAVADEKKTAQQKLAQDFLDAVNSGNMDAAKGHLSNLSKLTGATTAARNPNLMSLIIAANQGDPEAAKALQAKQAMDMQLMNARGEAFGKGRLWMLQKAIDPETGEATFVTGHEIENAKLEGKKYIPSGPLSAKDVVSVQQLQSEAVPAIQNIRQHLGAFDDPTDRKIFARVMKNAGTPARGQEASWMGTVLNQALNEGLSEKGKNLAIAEARLAETMGRMRSTLGLPATDQSMAISLALLPGGATPNSAFAGKQVDQLEQMIKQAVNVPIYHGTSGKASSAPESTSRREQHSPSTGQFRHSLDGGKTWLPGPLPRQ